MFNWFSNSKKENNMGFDSHDLSDHKLITVDWLNEIDPIYLDNGSTDLQPNTLYQGEDKNEVFLTTDDENSSFKFKDLIIEKTGGSFKKIDDKSLEKYSNPPFEIFIGVFQGKDITIFIKKNIMSSIELQIMSNNQ